MNGPRDRLVPCRVARFRMYLTSKSMPLAGYVGSGSLKHGRWISEFPGSSTSTHLPDTLHPFKYFHAFRHYHRLTHVVMHANSLSSRRTH